MYVHGEYQQSRRAKELTEELRQAIGAYRMRNPKLNNEEVRIALQNVTPNTFWTVRRRVAMIASAMYVVLVAGMIGVANERANQGRPISWIILGAIGAIGLVVSVLLWVRTSDS